MTLVILALVGCDNGFTLPSTDPDHEGPTLPGLSFKVRERVYILPGTDSRPAPPEPGVDSDDCDTIKEGGSVATDCVTAEIHCGETVVGHTIGGVNRYDSDFYQTNFCTPALTNHDGGEERVYRLHMPEGDWVAFVTLDTPCADLDIGAIKWMGDTCPPKNANVTQCDMFPLRGNERERLTLVTQHETDWYLVVEGINQDEGAFSVSVQCRPGLF